MAKRSDFAQKLIDDLKLRKERMNVSQSQRSSQSKQLPIDAYAYSKQTYRGSRNIKANENVSSRTGSIPNRSSRSHKSAKVGEVSNQIVPYGSGQSSGQMGDMSVALAFAFENGGKLRRKDSSFTSSIMNFLTQLKRGTLSFGKMERRRGDSDWQLASTSHFPAISPVQINEIHKGAQKLNQILSASSNGLTIDRRSIEFANELLQGAINLEESLRMLVDLQKNSEFMVTPQKKNRIKLLEEDDDDDDDDDIKTIQQKQLARPVFSFDKPSKHSGNLQRNDNTSFMQGSNFLNHSKGGKLKNEKQDVKSSKLLSHRRSKSHSSDIKNLNALSEQESQSALVQSNPEKSRIPNVIAKLMGLDNLPEKVEAKYTPQKDSGSIQKKEGMTIKHTSNGGDKNIKLKSKQTENLLLQRKQKVIEEDTELVFDAEKNLNMHKASSHVDVRNGTKALKGPDKVTIKKDKQHDHDALKLKLTRESRIEVEVMAGKQEHVSKREQKATGKGRTNSLRPNNMLTQMEQARQRQEVKYSLHEEQQRDVSTYHLENRRTNKHILSNQTGSENHFGNQKSNMVLKDGPWEENHHREEQLQQSEKQMRQARLHRSSETTSNNSTGPSDELINSQKKQILTNQVTSLEHNSAENVNAMNLKRSSPSHYDDLIRYEVSNDLNEEVKERMNNKSGQISSLRDQQSEQVKGRSGIRKVMHERSLHKIADKVKSTRKKKIDMGGKIDEVTIGRNGTMLHITKQVKQQRPILQQVKERTSDKFNVPREVERERFSKCITSSNAAVPIIEPLEEKCQPHKEEELPPILCGLDGGEHQSLQEPLDLVPSDLHHDVKSEAIGYLQDQPTPVAADEEFKTPEIAPYTINGMHEGRMDIDSRSQLQDQNISVKSPKPLTESENCLKMNLVKSQLFLNTAESLFRFNMPISIVQCGGHVDQNLKSSKLILDCGYEVMKRKGIRQELKVHPCSKISISTIRIRSLDNLVRQLNEDIEKLTFYGRSRSSEVDVEDYLPKMVENDVYNKDPDIDCMWELGWNHETFAFIEKYDAIKNMEKHVLNGLLDEITGELLNFQG